MKPDYSEMRLAHAEEISIGRQINGSHLPVVSKLFNRSPCRQNPEMQLLSRCIWLLHKLVETKCLMVVALDETELAKEMAVDAAIESLWI